MTLTIFWGYILRPSSTSAETSQEVGTPVSIKVTPDHHPKLITGFSQQFKANGTYSDGSIKDITSNVSWSISDTNIAIGGKTYNLAKGGKLKLR